MNGEQSETKEVYFGAPQGSLLGPRLFSILVNDLPESITKGNLHMYAGDTTVYVTGQHVEEVIDDLNIVADNIFEWCHKNKLTVHKGKTEAIIMSAHDSSGL